MGRGCDMRREWNERHRRAKLEPPSGFYVYAWFDADAALPYYIGMGSGERAWRKRDRLRLPARVAMLVENVGRSSAQIAEHVMIRAYLKLGAPLLNRQGVSRCAVKAAELFKLFKP